MTHFANDNSMNIFRLPVGWQYVLPSLVFLNLFDVFPRSAILHASERNPKLPIPQAVYQRPSTSESF